MTEGRYDMAIEGKGFFRIRMPSGETNYTRAGSFALSPTGTLVTSDGYTVEPGITIPQDATDVAINAQGQVSVKLAGQTVDTIVGQLDLAIFANESGLESLGDNLFAETASSGAAQTSTPGSTGFGTILHGYLETSNVNAVAEISALITAQRAYEMNSKVITVSDEMLQATSRLSR
jgi:flagellar basal-body rod protein FlgG